MKQETLEEEPLEFTLIEKELIEEAKKLWQESHPNPIEMALFGAKWMKSRMSVLIKKEQERQLVEENLNSTNPIFFKKEDGSVWIDLTDVKLDEKNV